MLRMLTAGESHGPKISVTIDGVPAGVAITTADIAAVLARRRLGAGRGARMKFEQDDIEIIGGVRHGYTMGGPVAIIIGNTEWPKWEQVMNPDPVDDATLRDVARNAPLTRPRPGHADFAGMMKYNHDDARPILERASARETAARTAGGVVAAQLIEQAAGIRLVSHTVALGAVAVPDNAPWPTPDDVARLDADPLRCTDPETSARMVQLVENTRKAGDTLGGVVEVIAYGAPVGLGSHAHSDRRLDGRLAGAIMSIQAIKGVEIGDGFATARVRGSQAHDEMDLTERGIERRSARSGGIEGGMSTGDPIRVRAAMKPISTVPKALATVDLATGESAQAIHQRSDVAAVPAAGVVAEGVAAFVLGDALLEKFGGDSLAEVQRNVASYRDAVASRLTFDTSESTL